MPTDMYGYIEIRDSHQQNRAESWACLMPLSPLCDGVDPAGFGCLFGVRNWLSWEPVAAGRGLPADVSDPVRADHDRWSQLDSAIHGTTWVSWAELRDLDMSVPAPGRGVLQIQEGPRRSGQLGNNEWPAGNPEWYGLSRRIRVDDEWPGDIVETYGIPPLGASPVEAGQGCWATAKARFAYESKIQGDFVGPGSGWEHVFAVMHALGQRFGNDGVRLVVWFD